MPKNKRLSPNKLAAVKADFEGLKSISDYKPIKSDFEVTQIQPVADSIDNLLEQEAQILAQLGDIRDQLADKGTMFFQKMKGAAQQVIAQYGDDSAEIQKLGRIRSSERSTRRTKKPTV
ncbi:MAG: hypothetical protein M3T96_02275 [Acidobacteriota bacterium]|nr:hypothetical protein [Acidobacteriota bacterium]